jgi:hypothetical protein
VPARRPSSTRLQDRQEPPPQHATTLRRRRDASLTAGATPAPTTAPRPPARRVLSTAPA